MKRFPLEDLLGSVYRCLYHSKLFPRLGKRFLRKLNHTKTTGIGCEIGGDGGGVGSGRKKRKMTKQSWLFCHNVSSNQVTQLVAFLKDHYRIGKKKKSSKITDLHKTDIVVENIP